MQYAVRTPTVGASEDGRWPITFANTFVLSVDQIQRVIPTYANKLILPAYALRLIGRSQEPFTHHREANPRFTVHLVMHNGLQGVLVCRREFAIRGKNAFSVGFNADWPPVCGGQYRMTRWCVGQGSLLNYWDYLFCRSMLLTNFRVFPGIFFMCRRHNQPPRSLW